MSGIAKVCYTLSGHLIGMLDRDQRTVLNAGRKSSASLDACPTCSRLSGTISENSPPKDSCTSPKCLLRRTATCPRRSMHRVKKVLAVVTYLLIVIPTALSAPSGHPCTSMENSSVPFYVLDETILPEENITKEQRQALRKEAAQTIHTQAMINCNKATHSLKQFTEHHFSMTPEEVHQRYIANTFGWLPSRADIPKQFGEDVTDGFSRTMEEEMVHLYHQFQKIGVGIEQIVKEYNNCTPNEQEREFGKNFQSMREDLTALLRELNMNIGVLGLKRKPDVSRDTMPNDDRNVNETNRRTRNWVIYRDYINALEYTIKAFHSHLSQL